MPAYSLVVRNDRLETFGLALLPVIQDIDPAKLVHVLEEGGEDFLKILLAQGLGPIWHHRLQEQGMLEQLPTEVNSALYQMRLGATAKYLAQRNALTRIDRLFESAGIRYLVMKGAHVRECVYTDPSLRPASDIDILVLAEDRQQAARALLDAGYAVDVDPANISHEACFSDGTVDIDLHWDILRPGRTRMYMTAGFLERRQRCSYFWGLSDSDALFLMLTHPAFTKYVCSPNMGLVQVADFLMWIQSRATDWSAARHLLDCAGLKTAAWTMLSWYRMLAPGTKMSLLDSWANDLVPGRLRKQYLAYWLDHDLPGRWLQRPLRIQLGFTLLLHDHLPDAWRAVVGRWLSRQHREQDVLRLLGAPSGDSNLSNRELTK
ncbi:MAG TPA: hypothetical protein DIC36_06495 [Gammaproteobacteria bacterium]|nr:hypothetical protein [Gammaproteobacteria bacterium]